MDHMNEKNSNLLELFLQKKCDGLENILKQKISKNKKQKIEIMFKKESLKDTTELENLNNILEKSRPILGHFHTSKEKSTHHTDHESLLNLKPRTRMAKMIPNYINSIDNNINSLKGIQNRKKEILNSKKEEMISNSKLIRLKNFSSKSKYNSNKTKTKKTFNSQKEVVVKGGSNMNKSPESLFPYSKSKRKPSLNKKEILKNKNIILSEKLKNENMFHKLFSTKLSEQDKLFNIKSIINAEKSKYLKNTKTINEKIKINETIFKKKISLPEKKKSKDTFRKFKNKWNNNEKIDVSYKDLSDLKFDIKSIQKKSYTNKNFRKNLNF